MKKGQILEGKVESVKFPDRGIVSVPGEENTVLVKNTLPGQQVQFTVKRVRHGTVEGQLLAVTERSPLEVPEGACPHFAGCGGCSYQTLPYEEQLRLKERQVLNLLRDVVPDAEERFEGIRPSPRQSGYRNKMEFTFGDEYKGGPLTLGMHRRGSFYDIVSVEECRIVDEDFRRIRTATQEYFRASGTPYYRRMRQEGYLRHLLVRKGARTGEILADLVTTTQPCLPQEEADASAADSDRPSRSTGSAALEPFPFESEEALLAGWRECLLSLELEGHLAGILHTRNDSLGDVIRDEGTDLLYGRDSFREEILGLTFRITPFSFFQTNSRGAEVLYETAREFVEDGAPAAVREGADSAGRHGVLPEAEDKDGTAASPEDGCGAAARARDGQETAEFPDGALFGKVVFDLYSGTGTIAQVLAPAVKKVVGVEIVEEAVEAARENAEANHLTNCEFLAGDVLTVLDKVSERPDVIVLDPPRDGVHPRALPKILGYGAERMLYISCKPTSLARDLAVMTKFGYHAERLACVDLFPGTVHVETVVLLRRSGT